ncbi:MAG TPA: hypothetical protein VF573_27340 [Paraburkholderia sp.]|uniref:hypothetical protein n=1 Tax=Paraburkholderia sp. TaxID=1926495 RepID=UPI002ED672A7
MATALSIINGAAGLVGILAADETLTAADAQDMRRRLNNMVSSWRTQFGTVPAIQRYIFPIVSNKQTYTIGPGGDFDVPRPMWIDGAGLLLQGLDAAVSVTITRSEYIATVTQVGHGYAVGDETVIAGADQLDYNGVQTVESVPTADTFTYVLDGTPASPATGTITASPVQEQPVEIPRTIITDDGYQSIQIKGLPNAQFTNVYYNPTFPFGTIVLWPRPNTAINQLVLYLPLEFGGFADLTTNYDYPDMPGYTEAMEYNLAVRIAAPWGRKLSEYPEVPGLARESLGLIKRANNRLVDVPTDASLLAWNRRGQYNINTGTGGY